MVTLAGVLILAAAVPAAAQTDYYNTDSGRPLTIEDARATERYAFEVQLAPLRLERSRGGLYRWEVEPEIAYGILPRTQLEIGAPFTYIDAGAGSRTSGLAGIEVSALHNLNVETALPAFAIAATMLVPVGGLAPSETGFSAKAIATRTFRWARLHVNGEYTFGDRTDPPEPGVPELADLETGNADVEVSRWLAGVAVDRASPLRAVLVGAEIFVEKSRDSGAKAVWNAAVGARRQLSPAFNIDAGAGRQLNGAEQSWFVTLGLAHAFAIRSLLPGRREMR